MNFLGYKSLVGGGGGQWQIYLSSTDIVGFLGVQKSGGGGRGGGQWQIDLSSTEIVGLLGLQKSGEGGGGQ